MEKIDLSAAKREETQGHTSKGDQPKWQLGQKWYKADLLGYETLSEVLISRLLRHSNVRHFVEYTPLWIQYQGKSVPGTSSQNFRLPGETLIPLERLHRSYKGSGLASALAGMDEPKERIRYTVQFIENATGLSGAGADLTLLLELDAFFLNEDRHTNNLAVIRSETDGSFRFCPVFDNGLGLLSDLNDYPLSDDLYACIGRVKAKPFSQSFDAQVDAAEELYGVRLNFSFSKKDVSACLSFANEFYGEAVCRRTKQVIFEQMRRYAIYFS